MTVKLSPPPLQKYYILLHAISSPPVPFHITADIIHPLLAHIHPSPASHSPEPTVCIILLNYYHLRLSCQHEISDFAVKLSLNKP